MRVTRTSTSVIDIRYDGAEQYQTVLLGADAYIRPSLVECGVPVDEYYCTWSMVNLLFSLSIKSHLFISKILTLNFYLNVGGK